jgi:hypothetical protein
MILNFATLFLLVSINAVAGSAGNVTGVLAGDGGDRCIMQMPGDAGSRPGLVSRFSTFA